MMSDGPVEYNKDGSVSKRRLHKGNTPVLPQTKLCPHCPKLFTRSTHLNRHLRTHSTSRDYLCNNCGAGFTRSDLLTRHARSCNIVDQRRRRQRSCRSCAQLKVKCDLDTPCRKCLDRGRECVYPTNGRLPTLRATGPRFRTTESEDARSNSSNGELELYSVGSIGTDRSYRDTIDSCASSSYGSSHSPSASPKLFLSHGYQSNMYESLFNPIFSPPASTPRTSATMSMPTPRRPLAIEHGLAGLIYVPRSISPPQIHTLATNDQENDTLSLLPPSPCCRIDREKLCETRLSIDSDIATLEELHLYQKLYEAVTVKQSHPLHATFDLQNVPAIFKRAMEAGGAMYVRNERARQFMNAVLTMARAELPMEYAQDHADPTRRIYTLRTTTILQTMGQFEAEHRAHSIFWFQLMIDMIRQTRTIEENTSWRPVCLSDATLDSAWREWAEHEHLKRLVWMAHNRDTSMVTFLGHQPLFKTSELTLRLPCEESLWNARSATEWLEQLSRPSQYGTVEERLLGVPFPNVWAAISSLSPALHPIPLGALAHFHLIQVILAEFFLLARPTADKDAVVYKAQFKLHKWLKSFLAAPDVPVPEPGQEDPPFFYNPLPFYWFGQLVLMAYKDDLPPFSGSSAGYQRGNESGEMFGDERLRLIKRWMLHVRAFLKHQEQSATVLWDELMRIRLDGVSAGKQWAGCGNEGEDLEEGMASFFVHK